MKYEKSCGAIIFENNKIMLIQQVEGHWDFPKGHVEENETEVETAKREIKEETNIDVEIYDKYRYVNHYSPEKDVEKDVVLFLAKKIGGKERKQEEEVQEIKWLDYKSALEQITFDNTKAILEQAWKDKQNSELEKQS